MIVEGDMLYPPVQALQALTRFQKLDRRRHPAHRHPGRHRAERPAKPVEIIAALLPPAAKWQAVLPGQAKNPKYLQDGDVVEATSPPTTAPSTSAPSARS